MPATPKMAHKVIEYIRTVTDKPIKYVVLSHYNPVRVIGAMGFEPQHIICSEATREMIVERGAQDYKSELQRFPRLFDAAETIPGLTWPTITFADRMSLWLGKLQVDIIHAGRGHTRAHPRSARKSHALECCSTSHALLHNRLHIGTSHACKHTGVARCLRGLCV